MRQMRAIVSGRVQRVMYRDFVLRTARRMGLTGTVQNLSDGRVLVIAEGDEKDLRVLLDELRKGSYFSRVDDVSTEWHDAADTFEDFHIVYKNILDRI